MHRNKNREVVNPCAGIWVMPYLWDMEHQFEVRNTREEDYGIICDWWEFWPSWKPVPRFMLPDNISDGLMVSYKGENLCAGFVYRTSASKLFNSEFIVSTYLIKDKKVRREGIRFLIKGLRYLATEMGAKVIYTSLNNDSLKKAYMDCGYIEGSKNCTELIYNL